MHTRWRLLAATVLAVAPPGQIPLPSPADHAATVPDPTVLLGPDRPNEVVNRSPGPIADNEQVRVGIGPGGDIRSVIVHQRLTVTGTGDFSLKIPGPALDVKAPPDAPNQPGLRRASVIWEGFSAGTKVLEADVTLDPRLETPKLPLTVTSTATSTTFANRTAIPVPMADAEPDAAAAADLLHRVRDALVAGRQPQAGADRVPVQIPTVSATTPVATVSVDVAVALHVKGTVTQRDGTAVPVDAIIPSPAAPNGTFTVPATGSVNVTVDPVPPDPATLTATTGRDELRAAETAMWQVLRLGDLAAYLGNPSPGSSVTTFVYQPAAVAAPVRPPHHDRPKPFAIALAIAVAALLLIGGTVAWARN